MQIPPWVPHQFHSMIENAPPDFAALIDELLSRRHEKWSVHKKELDSATKEARDQPMWSNAQRALGYQRRVMDEIEQLTLKKLREILLAQAKGIASDGHHPTFTSGDLKFRLYDVRGGVTYEDEPGDEAKVAVRWGVDEVTCLEEACALEFLAWARTAFPSPTAETVQDGGE